MVGTATSEEHTSVVVLVPGRGRHVVELDVQHQLQLL